MSVWNAVKPPAILTILGGLFGPLVVGSVYAVLSRGSEFDPHRFAMLGLPALLAIDVVSATWAGYRIAVQDVGGMTASALGGLSMTVLGYVIVLPLRLALYGTDGPPGYATSWVTACVASLVLGAVGGYFARTMQRREFG